MRQRAGRAVAFLVAVLGFVPATSQAQDRSPAVAAARGVGTDAIPAITWQPPKGTRAVRYRVRVLPVEGTDKLGQPVWEKADLTVPTTQYAGPPLDAKTTYVWAMDALDAQGRTVAAGGGAVGRASTPAPASACQIIAVASPAKICSGNPVTIFGFLIPLIQPGPTTYTLTGGGVSMSGTFSGSGGSIVPTPLPTATTPMPYTLTLANSSCQASTTVNVQVAPQPQLGPVTCADVPPPPGTGGAPSPSADMCCGSGLQCQAAGPVAGSIQWTANGQAVAGGTGAAINFNPGAITCPSVNTPTVIQATANTDPTVCAPVQQTVTVTVHPPPQPGTFSVSPQPVLCADGFSTCQVNYQQSGVGSLTWLHLPGCSTTSSPFTPSLPFPVGPLQQPDCYQVTVANGPCPPVVQTVRIDVDTPPVAGVITVPPPNPICPGDAQTLTLTGASGLIQWLSAPNCIPPYAPMNGATGNTVQNTNPLSSTNCYEAQVSSPLGVCPPVQTPAVPIVVQSLPVAPVVTGPQILCPGGSVTLSSSAAGQWYHNGDPVGPPPFTEPGDYWVTASNNCGSTDSNILTVNPDLLGVKIQGPCCDCNGGTAQLCAIVQQGNGPTTFQWNTGAVTPCITVHPLVTTTYTVTATDATPCSVSSSFIVTVCP